MSRLHIESERLSIFVFGMASGIFLQRNDILYRTLLAFIHIKECSFIINMLIESKFSLFSICGIYFDLAIRPFILYISAEIDAYSGIGQLTNDFYRIILIGYDRKLLFSIDPFLPPIDAITYVGILRLCFCTILHGQYIPISR